MYFGLAVQKIILCVSVHLWPTGRQGIKLQQPHPPLPLFAHLHYGHHHAMLPPQRLFQPCQPGSRLLRHCLLHPLPSAHLLLCLAGAHDQGPEDPGGRCRSSASPSVCYENMQPYVQ